MTSELQNQAVVNTLPRLSTVNNLPSQFPLAKLTPAAIHGHIFKASERFDSKGRRIAGNGLAASGAIIRRGRKVLIDVDRYGAWLSGAGECAK